MTVWKKIRDDLAIGAEKTGVLVREGAEAASIRLSYATKLASINWEIRGLQREIQACFYNLGKRLFDLQANGKVETIWQESKGTFAKLEGLEQQVSLKQKQKGDLPREYGFESMDKATVKELSHDLEESGGTILQITLEESSPVIGKKIRTLKLPKEALIGTIVRQDAMVIPDGDTVFSSGDKVTLLGKKEDVLAAIKMMSS